MKVKHLLFFASLAFFTFSVYKHSTVKSCKKQYEEYCQNLLVQQLYKPNNDPAAADTEQQFTIIEQQPTTTRTEGNRYDQDVEIIEQVITPKKRVPTKVIETKIPDKDSNNNNNKDEKKSTNKDEKKSVNKDEKKSANKDEKKKKDNNNNNKGNNQKAPQADKAKSGKDNLEVKVTHESPEFNFLGGYAYANVSLIRPPITYARSRKMNKIVAKNAKQKFLECTPAKLPKERFTPSKMQTKPFSNNVNNKSHLIFCASSGSSGTLYLANLLSTAKGVDSEQYRDPEMKGEWLSMANDFPLEHTKKQRSIKLSSIREYLKGKPKGTVYAETSSMFLKTFWDVVTDAPDVNVDVIVLRRYLPHVLIHMLQSGKGEAIRPDEYNTTHSVNALHAPPLFFPPDAFELLLRYAIDIELRAQALLARAGTAGALPRVRLLEFNLKDINTTAGAAKLLGDLGLEPTEATSRAAGVPLPVPYVPTTLAEKRRYLPCTRELSVREAKSRIFAYLTRLTPEHIPLLPQLRAPTTYAGRQPRIAAVAVVPKDFAGAQDILYAHLTNALQFAQTAVVVTTAGGGKGGKGGGGGIGEGLAQPKALVVAGEGFPNTVAAFMSVDNVTAPTHVICNDFLVGFSDSFRQGSLLQQLVLALEPGEALYVLPSKTIKVKRRHRLVAFALSKRIVEFVEASKSGGNGAAKPIKFRNLPFENKYYVNEGAKELDWYPRYNLVPILNA